MNRGSLAHLVHELFAGQDAGIRHRLMRGVQEPQLHQLVRLDVVDHLDANELQGRPAAGEGVLQDPLREGFGVNRPPILDAVLGQHARARLVRRHRRNAVDHRVGERHVLGDPGGEVGVFAPGEAQDRGPRHMPVALDVVAGHHRERWRACLPTPRQPGGDVPENARRQVRARLQIVQRERVARVELAGGVVDAVAALGDRQRHDARLPGRRGDRGPRWGRPARRGTHGSSRSPARRTCRPGSW